MGEGKLCLEPGNTARSTSSKTLRLYLYVDARRRMCFNTFPTAGLAVGAGRYGRHDHWTSNTWTTLFGSIFKSCLWKQMWRQVWVYYVATSMGPNASVTVTFCCVTCSVVIQGKVCIEAEGGHLQHTLQQWNSSFLKFRVCKFSCHYERTFISCYINMSPLSSSSVAVQNRNHATHDILY
jgi:hypothetical protein